jgi:rod shape-determining protein MreC
MNQTRSSWPLLLTLALLAFLGLVLQQMGQLQSLEGLLYRLTTPMQKGLAIVAEDVNSVLTSGRDLRELRRRNADLQSLVDSLMVENVRLKEVEFENQTLRQLLNFARANPWYEYKAATVAGRVVGQDPSNLLYYLIIDVGTRDGVARGMPVITDRGLVGRIGTAGPTSSKVLLITDPSSSVNAFVQSSRSTGIVRGDVGGGLIMERISQGEKVKVGDIVLTSGLGGNFPDKLVIGQISEVEQRDVELFQRARIRATVDFSRLEMVLVISNFTPVSEVEEEGK